MPALVAVRVPGRVVQVLQDFLPAELDEIDAALADGVVTPDVVAWVDNPAESVEDAPAVVVDLVATSVVQTWAKQVGRMIDSEHAVNVKVTVGAERASEDASRLQRYLTALIAGVLNVLTVEKERLETAADPSPFAENVHARREAITYGPEAEQEGGEMTRTATVPIVVRTRQLA